MEDVAVRRRHSAAQDSHSAHVSTRLSGPTPRAAKTKRLRAPRCPPRFDFSRSLPPPVPSLARADLDPVPPHDCPSACVCSSSVNLPRRRSGRRSSRTLCCAWRRRYTAERGPRYAPDPLFTDELPTFALKIHPAKLEIERRFDRIPPSTEFQPRPEGPTWSDRANRPAAIVGTILWLSVPRSDRDSVASRDRSRASWRGRFGENPTRGAEARQNRFLLFSTPRIPYPNTLDPRAC